jgi:hypothetical protein
MHCETQQRSLPRLLTLNAPMTGLRIPRAMNLPSRGRRVNTSNAHDESMGALKRPATEKRQRHEIAVGDVWRCREHYGDLVAAPGLMNLD